MSYYEYRIVPAPASLPRVRGVKSPEDRYAHAMTLSLNTEAHAGWEFQRSETMTTEVRRGWLGKRSTETLTVLVFRRWVETEDEGESHADWRETAATPEDLAAEIAQEPRQSSMQSQGQGPRLSASRGAQGELRPLPGSSRG